MRRAPDSRTLMAVRGALAVSLLLAGGGCRTSPVAAPATEPLPALSASEIDRRALLLLLVDRQIYEGFAVDRALEAGRDTRRELARALGRAGAPQGRVVLERLLADEDRSVRRAAVFALGELGEPLARGPLLEVARGDDSEAARLAVEALAKLGVDLATVEAAIGAVDGAERAARLAPSLFRFDPEERQAPATEWLAAGDAEVRRWAAYALCRDAVAAAAPVVRSLLAEPDEWIRGWAARALGTIGDGGDLERLRPLLEDGEPGPIVRALEAAAELVRRGAAAPPSEWKPRLLALADDERPGIRVTALGAMGAWLLDDDLAARLERAFERGSPRERQVALLALAEGRDRRASDAVRSAAVSDDLQLRRRAAGAAVEAGAVDVAWSLLYDEHPAVRADAVEALLGEASRSGVEVAVVALGDEAAAVRAAGARWLVDHPGLEMEMLLEGFRPSSGQDRIELEMRLTEALGARARRVDAERPRIVEVLVRLASEKEYLVRRTAAEELRRLEEVPPAIGVATESRDLAAYREIVERTAVERWVRIATARGDIVLRLACPEAPLTCLSFLQLAEQGFYDGLTFHRVVPDFVVQGGDPSGGGWGGPGYTLRDEINRLRFDTGVVGMAHAGADTAGSQFFVTLSPQPHLDGAYTAFGRVERGLEVLGRLEQEDVILSIRQVGAPGARSGDATGGVG